MSENGRNEVTFEDRLILDLLEPAAGNEDPDPSAGEAGSETARLRREYLEVLGLLPYGLEPRSPSPETKQRILDAIGASSTSEHPDKVTALPHPSFAGAGRPGRNWLLPLAASIALVMISVAGWLVLQVRGQQTRIAELSVQLDQARSATAALATSQGVLAEVRSRLALVTAPGAQFCALRPPEGSQAAGALGMVVMHPIKDEWFLRIEGLEPCAEGRKYVVWFSTEDGAEPGPMFTVESGEPVELTVSGRPQKINAIMITLEADPAPEAPSMEPLLFGDERMQLL